MYQLASPSISSSNLIFLFIKNNHVHKVIIIKPMPQSNAPVFIFNALHLLPFNLSFVGVIHKLTHLNTDKAI
jgi:hypothetical protein